jgi:hypothetical protein
VDDVALIERLGVLLAGGWRADVLADELTGALADVHAPVSVMRARAERRRAIPPASKRQPRRPLDRLEPPGEPSAAPVTELIDDGSGDLSPGAPPVDDATATLAGELLTALDDGQHRQVLAVVSDAVGLRVPTGACWSEVSPSRRVLLAPHLVTHLHENSPAPGKEPDDD